jgi:hypothetical protein
VEPPDPSPGDDDPFNPRTWPLLIAWIGRATWREWFKITMFVILVILAAHFAGWLW